LLRVSISRSRCSASCKTQHSPNDHRHPHLYSTLLAVAGFAGALLCGVARLLSLLAPTQLESAIRHPLASELRTRANAQPQRLQEARLGRLAERMLSQNSARIAQLKASISTGLLQRIDAVLNEMLKPDCECRQGSRRVGATEGAVLEIADLQRAGTRLTALLQSEHRELAAKLHRELRIFTGADARVLLAVGFTAALRRRVVPHLLPSALLILTATPVVAGFCLFGQDWLRTIVFGDYAGFGYVIWIGVVSLPLLDVVFNRGQIATALLNGLLDAVGSTASVCDC
jgi:hypothetical protein